MTLTDQIPGLAAAIEQEQLVRNVSFLGIKERVCGFDVEPLTLRHVITLETIGSPFLCGGAVFPHDVAAFLCVVTGAQGFRRWWMLRRLGRVRYATAIESVRDYVSEAMQDSPGGNSHPETTTYYSIGAAMVDGLALEYGWTEAAILDMPLKRAFQYFKIITRRNSNAPMFNPSDKVRGEWLREVNRN